MTKILFRSIVASHNKSDITNGFGNRDFLLAVCTGFLRKGGRLEVIGDFHSLRIGRNPFPVEGSIAEQK
jgi:hypothetical protein